MEHERLVQSTLAYYSRRSTWFVWILFGWKTCFACLHIWFARCFGSLGMHTNSGSLSLHLPHPILSISKMMTARLIEIPARLCVDPINTWPFFDRKMMFVFTFGSRATWTTYTSRCVDSLTRHQCLSQMEGWRSHPCRDLRVEAMMGKRWRWT